MKIAVSGKGGVGKTTVTASLVRSIKDEGFKVTAVDADPDANLAAILGYTGKEIPPLAGLKTLIEERVGGGGWGGFLRMNPRVDDIPERFGVMVDGVRILVMGGIEGGKTGCACPENVLLREVLNHVITAGNEYVVVDMEAGVEHLGRGTAEGVDIMLIVVEPGWASLRTARKTIALSKELGIKQTLAIANKIRQQDDSEFIEENLKEVFLFGELPFDSALEIEARTGSFNADLRFHREMKRLTARLLD